MTASVPTTASIDFGSTYTDEATLQIAGLADMTTGAHIELWMQDDDTTVDNDATAHSTLAYFMASLQPEARIAASGFTARARLENIAAIGLFKFHYIYTV